jgi:hypothetical protein
LQDKVKTSPSDEGLLVANKTFSDLTMLAARRLPEVLKSVLNDGVDGCCLMTEEGSILAAAFTEKSTMIDTSLAAISSSIWNNIIQGLNNLDC